MGQIADKLQNLEQTIEKSSQRRRGVATVGMVLESVLVPIVLFLCAFGFGAYVIYAKHRTRREYLETIKTLVQNGQPVPPELLSGLGSNAQASQN